MKITFSLRYVHFSYSAYNNNRLCDREKVDQKVKKISYIYLFIHVESYPPLSLIPIHTLYVIAQYYNTTIFQQYSFLKSILFSKLAPSLASSSFFSSNQGEDIRTIQTNVKFVSTLSTGLIEDPARINANIKGHSDRIGYVTGLGIPGEGSLKKRGGEKKEARTGIKSHRFRSIQEDTLLARPDSLLCKKNGELEAVDLELIFQEEGTRGISRMARPGFKYERDDLSIPFARQRVFISRAGDEAIRLCFITGEIGIERAYTIE